MNHCSSLRHRFPAAASISDIYSRVAGARARHSQQVCMDGLPRKFYILPTCATEKAQSSNNIYCRLKYRFYHSRLVANEALALRWSLPEFYYSPLLSSPIPSIYTLVELNKKTRILFNLIPSFPRAVQFAR